MRAMIAFSIIRVFHACIRQRYYYMRMMAGDARRTPPVSLILLLIRAASARAPALLCRQIIGAAQHKPRLD